MKYCSSCGARVSQVIPAGDNRPRYVCERCATVHYENPRVVVGCVPEYQGQILLCKRAIEPRLGFWTVPAGFLENGETLADGAKRECFEEANAHVEIGSLLAIIDVTYAQQVHILYRARLLTPEYGAGTESLEVQLFDAAHIPWHDMAFRSVEFGLRRYLADRAALREDLHCESLYPLSA